MARRRISMFSIVGVTALGMGIFVFLYFFAPTIGFSATLATNFVQLFPGILVFGIGMIVVVLARGIYAVPAMLLTGVGLCVLLNSLDQAGAISTIMLGGLTMNEIYLWTIVLSGLFGGILAALTTGK